MYRSNACNAALIALVTVENFNFQSYNREHHQYKEKEFPPNKRGFTFKYKDVAKNLVFGAII